MHNKKIYKITLALAGLFQAAALVRDLAKYGKVDEKAFSACVNSIYKRDAADITDVYGDLANLKVGFSEVIRLFGTEKAPGEILVSRYVISMIHLERKLAKNSEMKQKLAQRLKHVSSQVNYFSEEHPTVIASLADIYLSTLGTFRFRIQIIGQAKYLHQDEIIKKIRVLLLAGVRSAVLWRQVGGRRWQFFLWRNKITNMAKTLMA